MLSLEKQILYMLQNRHEVTTSELINIYSDRGKSEQVIRNTLSSLKKKGFVHADKRKYTLTDQGIAAIQSFQLKLSSRSLPWDGQWHFVLFSIPEQHRSLRNLFRRELVQIGYGLLYDGVFVCPYGRKSAVLDVITQNGLEEWVRIVSGDFEFGAIAASQVEQIWPIEDINKKYCAFIHMVNGKIDEWSAQDKNMTDVSPWNVLLQILELGERFGEILLEDPSLPTELLPDNWMMQQARELYHQHIAQLTPLLQSEKDLFSLIVPMD